MGDYWMRDRKNSDSARSPERQFEPDKLGGVCGGLQDRIF